MSHFPVAVIHREDQNYEDLLAPYDESLRVAPYRRYTRDEAIKQVRDSWKVGNKTDDECWQMMANEYDNATDEDGNIYSTYNQDSKWDWYQVGGRFGGMLQTKDGERCDEGRIGDLVFKTDRKAYNDCLRFWDVAIDHQPLRPGESEDQFRTFYKEEYYRTYYGDRVTYAETITSFSTYAVITPNGIWHGKGEMGWFGLSSETADEAKEWEIKYMDRFINNADKDLIITIVDCHI